MQSKYVITKWYICSPDLLEAKKHFVWCLFFTVFLEKKLHSHSWPFMLHSTNCKANLMCNSLAWISLSLCSLLLFLIKFYAWHSFMAYSRRQKINKSKLTKNTSKKKKTSKNFSTCLQMKDGSSALFQVLCAALTLGRAREVL